MHGSASHTEGRLFVEDMLPLFSLPTTLNFADAEQQLKSHNFAHLSLSEICPAMNKMIHLRKLMGLRSPVHTLVRLINPFNAQYSTKLRVVGSENKGSMSSTNSRPSVCEAEPCIKTLMPFSANNKLLRINQGNCLRFPA
jgi:anthranilate phosphoribosyltransferase